MARINLFRFFLMVSHNIAFNCSPINRHRFDLEYKQRLEESKILAVTSSEEEDEDLFDRDDPNKTSHCEWYWKLLHPVEVAKLILKYHMASSWFLVLLLGHLSLLVHFTTKCLVHTFYTGTDPARIEFFNSVYYPHLASSLSEPYLFNNLFLAMSIYTLIARLLSVHRLVKYSIINADEYNKIWITQVNMAVLPICEFTLREWYVLFWHSCNHEYEIKHNESARRAHLLLSPSLLDNLDNLSQKDLLFYVNAIDYNECFKELEFFNLSRRKASYQSWHCAEPCIRISTGIVRDTFLWFALAIVNLSLFTITILFGIVYLELRTAFPLDSEVRMIDVLSNWAQHLSEPLYLMRLAEFLMLTALQIPQHVDSLTALMDELILISRIRKVIAILEDKLHTSRSLKECRPRTQTASYYRYSFYYGLFRKSIADTCFEYRGNSSPEVRELNYHLQHCVKLIRLLHCEFKNIRTAHTPLMNLIVIGNGFCMAYTISLILAVERWPQYILLSVVMVSSLTPTINALIFSACIEKYLRQLYKVMSRFLVNEQNLLEIKTIKMLRIGSEAFELLHDRSMSVFGLYVITLDSVLPVSATGCRSLCCSSGPS